MINTLTVPLSNTMTSTRPSRIPMRPKVLITAMLGRMRKLTSGPTQNQPTPMRIICMTIKHTSAVPTVNLSSAAKSRTKPIEPRADRSVMLLRRLA